MHDHPPADPAEEPLDPQLAALLPQLPREMAPPLAQWNDVRARLTPRRSVWRRVAPLLAVAAALLLAFGLRRAPDTLPTPVSVQHDDAFERALAARTDLDPRTVSALRRNMAVIDSAVADSRRALAAAPGDPDITAVVAFAESQRRGILAQLARLQES